MNHRISSYTQRSRRVTMKLNLLLALVASLRPQSLMAFVPSSRPFRISHKVSSDSRGPVHTSQQSPFFNRQSWISSSSTSRSALVADETEELHRRKSDDGHKSW